jgi:hypothetical protein
MSRIKHICIRCATANGGVISKEYLKSALVLGECDVCGEPAPLSIIHAWENLNPYEAEAYRAKVATPKRTRAKKAENSENA